MKKILLMLVHLQVKSLYRHLRSSLYIRYGTKPINLHVGCGKKRFEGFINMDLNPHEAVDYVGDISTLPGRSNSIARIEWYHVIEHIPLTHVKLTLSKLLDVLTPGGSLITECPNLKQAITEYMEGNNERLYSIYGRQRFPGDAHHWGYTPEALATLLRSIGFEQICIKPAQDDHAGTEPCMRVECKKPGKS